MAATATAWLKELTDLYTPTATEFDGARGHRAEIESKLDSALGVHRMFEIGSLKHGTGVWRYSDADYLVSLKGERPSSELTTLNKVKAALEARFSATTIVIRRPAVVCKFSDGDVEIVPGFAAISGYRIPDPTGGWMLTHPSEHNDYVNKVNKKHGGDVKKLARQLKVWKYERDVPVSSCYLEMRAAKYMDGEDTYLPLWDLHAALKALQTAQLAAMNDPTGLSSRFGACSSEAKRLDAMSKLNRAVSRAQKARDLAKADKPDEAIAQLKLLFNR